MRSRSRCSGCAPNTAPARYVSTLPSGEAADADIMLIVLKAAVDEALSALGPAAAHRCRTTDQLDRRIIELVNETGTINARMVRILLDLDTVRASRVLLHHHR